VCAREAEQTAVTAVARHRVESRRDALGPSGVAHQQREGRDVAALRPDMQGVSPGGCAIAWSLRRAGRTRPSDQLPLGVVPTLYADTVLARHLARLNRRASTGMRIGAARERRLGIASTANLRPRR
jgi:hypothetical protein